MRLLAIFGGIGMLFGLPYAFPPLAELSRQQQFRLLPIAKPDVSILLTLKFRKLIPDELFYDYMSRHGFNKDEADRIVQATYFYPSPSDLVVWQAREVFEPEAIQKYGLDAEFERLRLEEFYKAGMTLEQIRNYWRAHWRHAAWTEVIEMLHRKQLTEEQVWEWFRLVEIPPFWRDKLIKIAYIVPTRVDTRRFYEMRTIDEDRLREIYEHLGYRGKDLEDYIIWTKIYVDFPDLIARFRMGWITEEQLEKELINRGMIPERARWFIETKVRAPVKPERVEKERDLTKSEIIKGIKKEIISVEQGVEMLKRLGYDEFEARFIIAVRVGMESSPETPLEFRKYIEDWRRAIGVEAKEIPKELLEAEKKYFELRKKLDEAIKARKKEAEIARINQELVEAEYRYRQLLARYELA